MSMLGWRKTLDNQLGRWWVAIEFDWPVFGRFAHLHGICRPVRVAGRGAFELLDRLCGVAEKATVSLGGAATSDNTLGPTPGCDALSEEGSFKLQLERPEVLTGLKGAA